MATTHVKTMGMACDVCSATVEMNLERLPGVISARTDVESGLTTVLYDPHVVDELEIADEIGRSGFKARLVIYPQFAGGSTRGATRGATTSRTVEPLGGTPSAPPAGGAVEPPAGLHVVHIKTVGLQCQKCTARVEKALSHIDGVIDVTAVQSLGLTSVLFDRSLVDRGRLAREIRRAGFGAKVVQ